MNRSDQSIGESTTLTSWIRLSCMRLNSTKEILEPIETIDNIKNKYQQLFSQTKTNTQISHITMTHILSLSLPHPRAHVYMAERTRPSFQFIVDIDKLDLHLDNLRR